MKPLPRWCSLPLKPSTNRQAILRLVHQQPGWWGCRTRINNYWRLGRSLAIVDQLIGELTASVLKNWLLALGLAPG